ncbi:MAG: hypothetical protein ACRDSR_17685 [Pseudonocardiaceae bacterium]
MTMIWGTVRRGSIALAGTFLALNLTGSSAAAMAGRSSAPTPGNSMLASGSENQPATVETARSCKHGLRYAADIGTCDPVSLVTE